MRVSQPKYCVLCEINVTIEISLLEFSSSAKGETPSGTSDTENRQLSLPDDSISTSINIKPLKMSSYLVLNDPKCNSDIHCTVPLDKELLFETCSVGIN